MLDPALGEDVAIANCAKTMVLTSSTGVKIGVIGLAEREWYLVLLLGELVLTARLQA